MSLPSTTRFEANKISGTSSPYLLPQLIDAPYGDQGDLYNSGTPRNLENPSYSYDPDVLKDAMRRFYDHIGVSAYLKYVKPFTIVIAGTSGEPRRSLTFLVNPSEISYGNGFSTNTEFSRNGVIATISGRNQMKVSLRGSSPGFYGREGLTSEEVSVKDNLPVGRKHSFGFLHFMAIKDFYKNNGYIGVDTKLTGNMPTRRPIFAMDNIAIDYDGLRMYGSFDSFVSDETADSPYLIKYSMEFTVSSIGGASFEGHRDLGTNGRNVYTVDHREIYSRDPTVKFKTAVDTLNATSYLGENAALASYTNDAVTSAAQTAVSQNMSSLEKTFQDIASALSVNAISRPGLIQALFKDPGTAPDSLLYKNADIGSVTTHNYQNSGYTISNGKTIGDQEISLLQPEQRKKMQESSNGSRVLSVLQMFMRSFGWRSFSVSDTMAAFSKDISDVVGSAGINSWVVPNNIGRIAGSFGFIEAAYPASLNSDMYDVLVVGRDYTFWATKGNPEISTLKYTYSKRASIADTVWSAGMTNPFIQFVVRKFTVRAVAFGTSVRVGQSIDIPICIDINDASSSPEAATAADITRQIGLEAGATGGTQDPLNLTVPPKETKPVGGFASIEFNRNLYSVNSESLFSNHVFYIRNK